MYSGWGVKFFDFDHDADLDLIVCNGHPDDLIETLSSTLTYKEPILLFRNRGGRFLRLGPEAGEAFTRMYPARGLAIGDLNNDGHPDVIVANNGAEPVVLQHAGATLNHWLGLAGIQPGWKITWLFKGRKSSKLKTAGGSYLSAHDPRDLLGLGDAILADSVEIAKPDGSVLRFERVKAGRYYTLSRDGNLR